MSHLPKIDGILRTLREDASGTDIGREIGEAVKKRFPKGKLSFEPVNEFNSFYGLRQYKVKSGHPMVIELEFEEETPMGPDDTSREIHQRDYMAQYDAAMEDWREFLASEVAKIAGEIKRGIEVSDVETPHTDVALVTLEQGSV